MITGIFSCKKTKHKYSPIRVLNQMRAGKGTALEGGCLYLGLEGGENLRPGARFWSPPWRGGGEGGRRGCFQAGF
jgi:hypothetical protein